jgi:hypothetical protein
VLIAFAQEFSRYANRVSGDYTEARKFFEEVDFLPHTKYYPGFIGGHCVIPNIQLLHTIASSPLFEAVLESNRLRAEELTNEAKDPSRPALTADSVTRGGKSIGGCAPRLTEPVEQSSPPNPEK